jgi:hypothetical protein
MADPISGGIILTLAAGAATIAAFTLAGQIQQSVNEDKQKFHESEKNELENMEKTFSDFNYNNKILKHIE